MDHRPLRAITVRDARLGVQGWAGQTEPDPDKIEVPVRTETPRSKPPNGFFTSTWDAAERSTAWIRFMADRKLRPSSGRQIWTFVPDPERMLLVIGSDADFVSLAHAYPHRNANERDKTCTPNWYEIATRSRRPFDAVHVTAEAAAQLEELPQRRFNGWNVESTLWFVLPSRKPEFVGLLADDWTVVSD